MANTKKDTKRQLFSLKLTDNNYRKLKEESEKLEISMSAFLALLIADYKWIKVIKQ